jgi:serine/threonine-protein kinase
VSEAGGEPKVLTKPAAEHGELSHLFPSFLPDGRAVLFTITSVNGTSENAEIAALNLKSGERKILIRGGSHAQYVDSTVPTRADQAGSAEPGYLVHAAAGTLRAVRFDPTRLEVLSDPNPVVDQVLTHPDGAAQFSISRQGALVYVAGGSATMSTRVLTWVDRQGHEALINAPPRAYIYPRLSPDGKQVALDIRDQNQDIWILDLERGTLTRLTDDPAADWYPVWTPDSRRIIFASGRTGVINLFWQPSDNTGTVERLTTSANAQFPASSSAAGVIFTEVSPKTARDVQLLRLDLSTPIGGGRSMSAGTAPASVPGAAADSVSAGAQSAPHAASAGAITPLLHTTFNEDNGEVSPDGHWLAYQSDDGGPNQIHVRPLPNTDSGRSRPLAG